MAMDPEKKAKWVEDLRSGNFQQGKGALHSVLTLGDGTQRHTFCCLGVFAEQAVAAGACERNLCVNYYIYFDPENPEDRDFSVLPNVIAKWAGLADTSPHVQDGGGSALATINDHSELTFSEIADLIEADETL